MPAVDVKIEKTDHCLMLAIVCAVRYVAPKELLAARRLRPDINPLMMVAVAGAVAIHQRFEAATVSFFFALALALEAWSLDRARRAVAVLMELAPAIARVRFPDGNEREVPVGEVSVGMRVIVRPGDKIPLDGRVAVGTSEVNQQAQRVKPALCMCWVPRLGCTGADAVASHIRRISRHKR